jgi:hypothetical protein
MISLPAEDSLLFFIGVTNLASFIKGVSEA